MMKKFTVTLKQIDADKVGCDSLNEAVKIVVDWQNEHFLGESDLAPSHGEVRARNYLVTRIAYDGRMMF